MDKASKAKEENHMKILITRHEALVEFLQKQGLEFDMVVSHADAEIVKGKDVYGVLPLHLAALANTITSVDMNLPAEMRGKELSLEDVERYFVGFATYKVSKIA